MKELTQAVIPLLDVLSDLILSFYHASFHSILIELTKNTKEGLLLSEAVSLFPWHFDATCIQLLKLDEQKCDFSFDFKQLEEYWKFQKQLHDHIKKISSLSSFINEYVYSSFFIDNKFCYSSNDRLFKIFRY